jgi:DnaJ-class molecular chaperone
MTGEEQEKAESVACRYCNGDGWTAGYETDGTPVQVECEGCFGEGRVRVLVDAMDQLERARETAPEIFRADD